MHLAILGSLLFLVLALNTFVGMHAILSSKQGLVAGATYTDINARLPLMKLQIALAVVAAALILANIFVRRSVLVVSGIGAYLVAAIVGGAVYPALLHKFVVAPNELVKETPYIKLNIAATRRGFGLAAVEERNISGQTGLSREDIEKNGTTIRNIRLWDHRPLLDTFSQVQEIRTYYDFTTVSNDRYLINGEYQQTMLSPRELSSDSIPTKNWINETLTFTHGYGLTLGPVTQVTPEGLPVLLVKDIPPVSSAAEITVTRPEIYYGKLSSSYVIVNTKSKEFDYPAGEDNVFTEYAGAGGVKIDSLLRKLAFTAHFGSMKLLLSNDVTAASRVLYHRNIAERVGRVLPFLRLDSDPHMVVTDDGRLVWMYDAYTVSDRFPYSQPVGGGVNYIRNSVKITIDAYDGSMKFYIADPVDPIAQTIANVFPGVLRPIGEMPEDLRRHIRYPLDIFGVQTAVYSTYHMEDPQSFYNREDQWEIPVMGAEDQRAQMESYYTIMKLPGEKKEEFILMIPFNPKKKDNLSAWMVARSDGDALREDGRLPLPEGPARLRPEADRGADQPGHRDLAAGLALGPARVAGHAGDAAGDPDRELADLRPAAVPARRDRQDPGAQAGDRGLREQDRHGGDPRARAGADLRRECGRGAGRRRDGRRDPGRRGRREPAAGRRRRSGARARRSTSTGP